MRLPQILLSHLEPSTEFVWNSKLNSNGVDEMFYLGVLVLLAASAHLVFLFAQQLRRARSYELTMDLERQILERQVDEIIAKLFFRAI